MNIKRISRSEIDKQKWNSCVHFANNGNICGYKWYLDALSKDWEALIEEDYGTVFPLVWKKNWLGRKKIYQPSLILEGGIFSEKILSATRIKQLIEAIPTSYKSFSFTISSQAKIPQDMGLKITKETNRQLILNQPYEGLEKGFTDVFHQKLEDKWKYDMQPTSNLKPEKIVDFYKKYSSFYTKENYHAYLRIMYNVLHRGWGFANGVINPANQLLAANFFIYSHGKIVNFLPVVSPEGRHKGAMELLLNLVLQTHANKPVILDFNGYEDFGIGAQAQFYYEVSG